MAERVDGGFGDDQRRIGFFGVTGPQTFLAAGGEAGEIPVLDFEARDT